MPAQLSASQTEFRDDTKLIIFKSRRAVRSDRKRDLARQAGVTCIHLIWTGGKAPDEAFLAAMTSVSGFQAVDLALVPRAGGGYRQVTTWRMNSLTGLPKDEGTCTFVPDEMGVGHAYLPDSPHNRVKLAYAVIGKNALWRIPDDDIRAEIDNLAAEIVESPEYKEAIAIQERKRTETQVRREEMAASGEVIEKKPIELENIVLERKIKELEASRKNRELKDRLKKITGEAEAAEPAQETRKSMGRPVSAPEARAVAKAQIYEENADLIQKIKNAYSAEKGSTKGWAMSAGYIQQIRPLVEERLKEILDADKGAG